MHDTRAPGTLPASVWMQMGSIFVAIVLLVVILATS